MKKTIHILLSTLLCILFTGCQSSKDATKIYKEVITQMNKDIYYYKGTAKEYNPDNLYSTIEMEQLKGKDNKLYYISDTALATDENVGELTVMDGRQVHRLAYDKNTNANIYTVEEIDKSLMHDARLFNDIIETSPMPLKESYVKDNGKQLHFIFMEESNPDEKHPKLEYNIFIENNRIVEMERLSYGTGDNTLTMRTVTHYRDFNKNTSVDTKSIIDKMQIYQ